MLRITKTALGLALVVLSGVARAEFTGEEIVTRARPVNVDTVLSIGATTVMNADDAIVSVPGSGKIVASANADVFCADNDETARHLVIDVKSAGDILLDFCEQHLERRDITIKFIAEQ
jgi:hypothetical protein